VNLIQTCLDGYDKLSQRVATKRIINSTHVYEKESEVSADDAAMLEELRDRPVGELFKRKNISLKLQHIMLYAIGGISEDQSGSPEHEKITCFDFFERI